MTHPRNTTLLASKCIYISLFTSILLLSGLVSVLTPTAIAQRNFTDQEDQDDKSSRPEDALNASTMLPWRAGNLPENRSFEIRESLVNTVVGRVVMSRQTLPSGANQNQLIKVPIFFLEPLPGSYSLIALWGSKIEGCFVEVIVQHAPMGDAANLPDLVPTLLEVGIGDQIVRLPPQAVTPKVFQSQYKYRVSQYQSENRTWYMTRNLFQIDAAIAGVLSNAPAKSTRARITLSNRETKLVEINPKVVAAWKEVFSFNPNCKFPRSAPKR
jgi:hypothetical protein